MVDGALHLLCQLRSGRVESLFSDPQFLGLGNGAELQVYFLGLLRQFFQTTNRGTGMGQAHSTAKYLLN